MSCLHSALTISESLPNNCFCFQHTDAIEFLIHSYPKFVTVGSLPCDAAEDRVCFLIFCLPILGKYDRSSVFAEVAFCHLVWF